MHQRPSPPMPGVPLPEVMDNQLEEILNSMPGVVVQGNYTVDGPRAFLYVSKGAREVFGVSSSALKANSQLFFDICHPDDLPPLKASIHEAVSQNKDWVYSWRVIKPDGKTSWVRVSSRHFGTLADNSVIRVSNFVDITREKSLEKKLRLAQKKAEQANKAKSAFLASVSHEMRTPLNGILGYSQILSRQLDLTGQNARNLESLQRCGKHLLAVINDVLDMARIESGRLSLQAKPTLLQKLLFDVGSVITPLAASHGLNYSLHTATDLPDCILIDATRLKQVLINLLNNAVKFTDKGHVDLHVQRQQEQLQFVVTDTGCGIPRDKLTTIFQPFARLDNHYSVEGTGLGLAITSHIIHALHGHIAIDSEVGEGSRFTITIPFEEATLPERDISDTTNFNYEKLKLDPPPRILVVDDRESNRDILKQILTMAGFKVSLAENGQDALDKLHRRTFDLVLSDLRMPVMGGLELLASILQEPKLANIPCIAISASVFPDQIQQVLKAGFRTFLPKPCSLPKLLGTVYDALHIHPEPASHQTMETAEQNATDDTKTRSPHIKLDNTLSKRFHTLLDIGDIEELEALVNTLLSEPEHTTARQQLLACLNALDLNSFSEVLETLSETE
ncbi:PAS domain-containing hybrid sensor histidine kinase/response regulator [Parendozoicomonas haliclonae]|uniref:histidine kinase n=1 Tax=Parendozoicomonas haliclonae TaxID=1960125 RepID=A0A1X7AM91_9GAMM|nr:PAS domain-containing hybrid sensor histidine kinase/response regulator [Parendozoicomonas haliclonae]SMA49363.1 Sensory/regulatory protein RpfC [Parendozoicomonas haliclonae]